MTRNSHYPGSMTAREFVRAVERASVTDVMLSRARRVLVDDETVQAVADADGVSVFTVYRAVRQVRVNDRTKLGYWPGLSPTGE